MHVLFRDLGGNYIYYFPDDFLEGQTDLCFLYVADLVRACVLHPSVNFTVSAKCDVKEPVCL
eukprot:scaffold106_cov380-Prasinococcus_capsulatus_cf.AAC.31